MKNWLRRATWVDFFLLGLRAFVLVVVGAGLIGGIAHPRYGAGDWTSFLIFGLTIGALYALIALGYTMVYGILRLVNFAHGDIFVAGSFAACFGMTAMSRAGWLAERPVISFALALLLAMLVSGLVAVATERIAYRPFRNSRAFAPLICAIGVSFVIEYALRGMFGAQSRAYPDFPAIDGNVALGGIPISRAQLVAIAAAVLTMAALHTIVMHTRMGRAMRAVAEDRDAAVLMGIAVDRVVVFTFMLGGAVAGVAGLLYGLVFKQIFFFTGFFLGVKGFCAAVLGGIGNIPGAMLGGIALGLVESLGPALFLDGLGIAAPYQLRDAIAYTMLLMVLIFRPRGFLGERLSAARA
jgi:branched-chain amino acid transport system permease protein